MLSNGTKRFSIIVFVGMGKGLVGAFTRPASGVVDFASTSFDGLKRAAENIDEARRVRPPRFLHKDGVLRPYIHVEAEGNDILQVELYFTIINQISVLEIDL